jgi:hypothetical protein
LVEGFHFDRVKDVDNSLHQIYGVLVALSKGMKNKLDRYKSALMRIWEQKASECTAYTDGEQRESAFAASMTAGTDTGYPSTQGEPFNYLDFRAVCDSFKYSIDDTKEDNELELSNLDTEIEKLNMKEQTPRLQSGPSLPNIQESKARPLPTQVQATAPARTDESFRCEFHFALQQCHWSGQQFFTTERGYMGYGPPNLQPGDDVCVIFGGLAPFALRKRKGDAPSTSEGSTYKLVGECYLHEIMHGEAIEELRVGTLKKEIFDIR